MNVHTPLFFHFQAIHHKAPHLFPIFGTYKTGVMKMNAAKKPGPVVLVGRVPEGCITTAFDSKFELSGIGVRKIIAKDTG